MDTELYSAYYASLALEDGQIRLVTVHPAASWSKSVVCHIDVVDLSQKPQFCAISYTWGGQKADHLVKCDDATFPVTQSCVDALKGIRQQSLRVLWIDQLSINQLDVEEKNKQVLLMQQIYSQAQRVVISLGDWESKLAEESKCFREELNEEASGRVIKSFNYPVPQDDGSFKDLKLTGPKSAVHASIAVADELMKELTRYLVSATHFERIKPLFAVATAWKVVAEILSSPYWRRKFVIQEIALNPEIQIMIGPYQIQFRTVVGASFMINRILMPLLNAADDEKQFRQHAEPYIDLLGSIDSQNRACIMAISQTVMALIERDTSKLLLRLARPTYFKTTLLIDAVYAVRALMQDLGDLPVPRYGEEPDSAFVEYSRWFVEHGYGAEMLIARTCDGTSLAQQRLPTWCIEWSSQHMTLPRETLSYNIAYFQGQNWPKHTPTRSEHLADASKNIVLMPDCTELKVTGSRIDTITELLPQAEGCNSSLTVGQVCEFIKRARDGRRQENAVFIKEHLFSEDRESRTPGLKVRKQSFLKDHQALLEDLEELVDSTGGTKVSEVFQNRVQQELENSLMHHWTFCTSEEGWTAVIPEHTRKGDILINVNGLDAVFALRPQDSGQYSLVGQAAVIAHVGDHGMALAMSREKTDFVIC